MFANQRSNRSPPKIRLKMENHEKYESFFNRSVATANAAMGIDNTISSSPYPSTVTFKPLNPPPFALSNVASDAVSSSRSTPTFPYMSSTDHNENGNFVATVTVTPNSQPCATSVGDLRTLPTKTLETFETQIHSRPNTTGSEATNCNPNANDTHDAAVLLASIRNLVVEKEQLASHSFMPKIPQFEKHFKRDDDKKKLLDADRNMAPFTSTSFSSSSSLSTSLALSQSPFQSSNVRARTVSMDAHSFASTDANGRPSLSLRGPFFAERNRSENGNRNKSESLVYVSPPSSPSMYPLPAPTITMGRMMPINMDMSAPMTMTSTIHKRVRVADRRKRYLEESYASTSSSSAASSAEDEASSEEDDEQVLVHLNKKKPVPLAPAPKRLKSSSRSPKKSKTSHNDNTSIHSPKGKSASTPKSLAARTNYITSNTIDTTTTPNSPKAILRKKFSWKNFPELEKFLIDNREEYLRHSALNYTMQQKQYNNHLTERLIDLATECGYAFDSESFTFVTIRDRIRCYFKSYVQSRKKRGVIIGYAARKAGLLGVKELEKSISNGASKVSAGKKRR